MTSYEKIPGTEFWRRYFGRAYLFGPELKGVTDGTRHEVVSGYLSPQFGVDEVYCHLAQLATRPVGDSLLSQA